MRPSWRPSTESIRVHGILQPILVTETIDGYRLVAGERRLRAASAAGLERIPAVVRQLDDQTQLEVALIENLQREDLDAIEAARGFRRLIDEFGFSPELIAARVGRARSTVANTLRLLELAPSVQAAVGGPADQRRPRSGPWRPLGRPSGPCPRHGHRAGPVGSPDRGAGAAPARTPARPTRPRQQRRPRAVIPTWNGSRRTSAARLGHEGEPRPIPTRRPDRDRVLQR